MKGDVIRGWIGHYKDMSNPSLLFGIVHVDGFITIFD